MCASQSYLQGPLGELLSVFGVSLDEGGVEGGGQVSVL